MKFLAVRVCSVFILFFLFFLFFLILRFYLTLLYFTEV